MGDENDLEYDIGDIVIDLGQFTSDTIDISSLASSVSSISTTGASNYVLSSNGTGTNWVDTSVNSTMNVNGNVVINEEGDIKLGDRSLKEFMTKMEDRLAILVPDPAKLEKFEALKKAYDHYKMMEKLCEIENKDEEK